MRKKHEYATTCKVKSANTVRWYTALFGKLAVHNTVICKTAVIDGCIRYISIPTDDVRHR